MPGSSANSLLYAMPVLHTFLAFVGLPSFILHQKIIISLTVIIPYYQLITKCFTTHPPSSVHGPTIPHPIHPLVCHDKTQGLFLLCADLGNPSIHEWQFKITW